MKNEWRYMVSRMSGWKILIMLFFWSYGLSVQGAVYYVSSSGADDRDGQSPETAWRTLDRVNEGKLKAGDTVLFRRGDTWRGQLIPQSGDETGYVTYGAYGAGDKPVLLGSVSKNEKKDWKKQEVENVWSTVPPVVVAEETLRALTADAWQVHREGPAKVTAAVVAEENEARLVYRLDCTQSGERNNQIQLYVSGLTVKKGETYQLRFRARSEKPFAVRTGNVMLMKQARPWNRYGSCELSDIEVGTEWREYSMRFRASVTAEDGRITFFLGGALPAGSAFFFAGRDWKRLIYSEEEPIGYDVGNVIFDEGQAVGVKKWEAAKLQQEGDFWYDRAAGRVLMFSGENPAKKYRSIELALGRYIVDESGKSYVVYDGLALRYGAIIGIGGWSTHDIIVRNCDISYIGGGYHSTTADGRPVRCGNGIEFWANAHDCLVERCRLWEIYDAAVTNQNSSPNVKQYNITYRQNVIWNCEYSFEYWNRPANSLTHHIYFEQNTCVNAGYGWGHGQRPDPSGRHLCFYSSPAPATEVYLRNNIFFEAKGNSFFAPGWKREALAELVMDHNCWYQGSGEMISVNGQKFRMDQFDEYKKVSGQEEHSFCADPLLVNIAQGDFHLTKKSGCIDAGTDLGLKTDFDGAAIPQGAGADIGAYEFQGK